MPFYNAECNVVWIPYPISDIINKIIKRCCMISINFKAHNRVIEINLDIDNPSVSNTTKDIYHACCNQDPDLKNERELLKVMIGMCTSLDYDPFNPSEQAKEQLSLMTNLIVGWMLENEQLEVTNGTTYTFPDSLVQYGKMKGHIKDSSTLTFTVTKSNSAHVDLTCHYEQFKNLTTHSILKDIENKNLSVLECVENLKQALQAAFSDENPSVAINNLELGNDVLRFAFLTGSYDKETHNIDAESFFELLDLVVINYYASNQGSLNIH